MEHVVSESVYSEYKSKAVHYMRMGCFFEDSGKTNADLSSSSDQMMWEGCKLKVKGMMRGIHIYEANKRASQNS